MLRVEIDPCTQPVLEVQPGKHLNFVGDTGALDAPTMYIRSVMRAIEGSIGAAGSVWFVG
jgi:hypothetical protein